MTCFNPRQAFKYDVDGKVNVKVFSSNEDFRKGKKLVDPYVEFFLVPCGSCDGCRLERSRQWAVRIMHEAQMYEHNCFLTLTFSPEALKEQCPTGSIDRLHMQLFLKRLRKMFSPKIIRAVYCGEYGSKGDRPHYHLCIFNHDFSDKVFWKDSHGNKLFISETLSKLWPFGHCSIGELTFASAAYVARYCLKKVNGNGADSHYLGRTPEFFQASLKPGIGSTWLDKYGKSDCFNHDNVVVNAKRCKPPRYYDKRLEKVDLVAWERNKEARLKRAKSKEDDNSFRRLVVKEKCHKARSKLLLRNFENGV